MSRCRCHVRLGPSAAQRREWARQAGEATADAVEKALRERRDRQTRNPRPSVVAAFAANRDRRFRRLFERAARAVRPIIERERRAETVTGEVLDGPVFSV